MLRLPSSRSTGLRHLLEPHFKVKVSIKSTLASGLSRMVAVDTERSGALAVSILYPLIASPELDFDGELSTGKLKRVNFTAQDKLISWNSLLQQHKSDGKSVFVGDSVTDVLVLLRADVPIVIGTV